MKEKTLSLINDVITVKDGESRCCIRIMGWIAFFSGSVTNIYTTLSHGAVFNYTEFCSGTAILMGAVGAAVMMKKNDEPG